MTSKLKVMTFRFMPKFMFPWMAEIYSQQQQRANCKQQAKEI